MYSDVFCKVYNTFGWNYYPEIFGQQLLKWMARKNFHPATAMDLACGTGVLCQVLKNSGIRAAGMDFSRGMIEIARAADPEIAYTVADMTVFRPDAQYDLVTCTGDALNHIPGLRSVRQILENVSCYLAPGGYFVFDLLKEQEVSDSEPFEMDFDEKTRVWFQMTRPGADQVTLTVRVYEAGVLALEENIRETLHDPAQIRSLLEECGFLVERFGDSLLDDGSHGTTWFVVARKPG